MHTINSDRLIIRPFNINDQYDIFEMVSDKDTCYDDGGYEPFESMNEEYDELMKRFLFDKGRYILELKENHKVIGLLHIMDVKNRAVMAYEIGYIINKDYRRNGYASEAVNAIINDYFLNSGVKLITAVVFSFNKKSMCMLEKLGFVKEGITHKALNHCKYGLVDMFNYYIEL